MMFSRAAVSGLLLSLLLLSGCATPPGGASRFEIGLMGDTHYDAVSTAQFPAMVASLNRADLAFVVHVGDIGHPTFGVCLDETYVKRRDEFNAVRHPLVYTPGDNEWTDCHQGGIPDSLERLGKVREVFFQGEESLGARRMPLTRQSRDARFTKYRENARWEMGGVMFATLHVVGSNNNLARTPEMDKEHAERDAVNLEWLRDTFRAAKAANSIGLMILMQANPFFEMRWPARRRGGVRFMPPPANNRPDGFAALVPALTREVMAYDKPIVLVHGDTHTFRIDKPMIYDDKAGGGRGRSVEHFTRVELFGFPESHWVRAVIDPADPNVFSFRAEMVRENAGAARP